MSEAEQLIFFREHVFDLPLSRYRPLGNPTRHLEALASFIGRVKDENWSPEVLTAYAEELLKGEGPPSDEIKDEAEKFKELAAVYRWYQRGMMEEGKVDFGDLLTRTLELFRSRPAIT